MSYTITNNIMYVRDDTGELVPVSMIASDAKEAISAINTTAENAKNEIDSKVNDANTAIEAKTDEQVARIPEVTTLAEDVSELDGKKLDKTPGTWPTWTTDEKAQARGNIDAAGADDVANMSGDLDALKTFTYGKHAYGENIVVKSVTKPAGAVLDANSFAVGFFRKDIGASGDMLVLDCIACLKAELEANETDYAKINNVLLFQPAGNPWGKGATVKAEWGKAYWFYATRRDAITGFSSTSVPSSGDKLIQIRNNQLTYTTTGPVTITYTALRLYANGI